LKIPKRVIRIRKSKDRQYNSQNKKDSKWSLITDLIKMNKRSGKTEGAIKNGQSGHTGKTFGTQDTGKRQQNTTEI